MNKRADFAASLEQMLALRFLQAIGGGFATVICLATVRDVYPVEQLGRRFATVTMVLLIAPLRVEPSRKRSQTEAPSRAVPRCSARAARAVTAPPAPGSSGRI